MKLFMAVLFATLALNGVLSLPARTEDAEVIGGPRRVLTRADDDDAAAGDDDDFTNFKGVIDTGSGYPFLQPNPSVIRVGFFDSFDDLFRRFSARLFPVGVFSRAGSDDSDEDDDSTDIGFPTIDPKKANSTSTVKVVDGHKVEVNETVYGDENSVFKVRVVNIRPLEDGETVEETENKDIKPVTQGPEVKAPNAESTESEEKREPLEKKPLENEIQGNIDEPEHSIAKKENIVETTAATTIPTTTVDTTTMLPTTEDINAAFVTDNSLEQQEYSAAEELQGANGNGNNEFETNMSEDNDNSNNDDNDDVVDNIDNVENPEVEHTIENNEDTEEEVNDNLNESSSSNNADDDDSDKEQQNNENDDDEDANADADVEIVNLKKKLNTRNYSAAIRNKEREDESSSDDEDAIAPEMHPTFNDEWGSINEPTNEQNDLSNDIDVYDVVPIDLSNDIAVNDAADLPLNPDAEFIDVYGVQHQSNSMPKFEKLSLDYQPPSEEDWSNAPAK
ncbi:TNF receptor-associated factor family protein DDB_G0272098 [Calliphora vicina]|uniref:TNF receptor-associated factor family protein DDB_G0272098 n=1 Tax=Calliphora vicina TaxID=7373 RepID=UPI00325C012B